jgi:RND superfamily putative drug exporter
MGPYDPSSRALVASLRHGQLTQGLADVHYVTGGETAMAMDATGAMFGGLWRVVVVLAVVIAGLLMLALRSILLPIKAVVLVALSLAASVGGLLALTGSTVGSRLIGAGSAEALHPIVPVTILAIVVALSTDYEVILLSRISEAWERTGDNRASIVEGVADTGGVITSAAAVMIAVFVGFGIAQLQPLKQLGVGLSLAVFLDATVVRAILVPASMALIGRWNWWRPGVRTPSANPSFLGREAFVGQPSGDAP